MCTLFPPVHSCGEPPWFVYMVVNLGSRDAKKTAISIHSNPILAESAQNNFHSYNNEIWHTVMLVGPFTNWDKACHFATSWSKDIRGTRSRVYRGLALYCKFHIEEKLNLYLTTICKQDAIRKLIEKISKNDIYSVIIKYNSQGNSKAKGKAQRSKKPEAKYLTQLQPSMEDYSKLAYWSEKKMVFQQGVNEIDFTTKTLAWVFEVSTKRSNETKIHAQTFNAPNEEPSEEMSDDTFINFDQEQSQD